MKKKCDAIQNTVKKDPNSNSTWIQLDRTKCNCDIYTLKDNNRLGNRNRELGILDWKYIQL